MESELETGAYAAVIVEGIQGVGGIQMPDTGFLQSMRELCTSTGTLMIVDEVQSGYGRTGKFFAHQHPVFYRISSRWLKGWATAFR